MPDGTVVIGTLTLFGAGVFLFSVLETARMARGREQTRLVRHWRVVFWLNLFFLSGYVACLVLFWSRRLDMLAALTGAIFFTGSVLGLLVARGGNRAVRDLLAETVPRSSFDRIVESLTDAVIVTDGKLRIRTANEAATCLTGYPRSDLVGQPLDRVFSRETLLRPNGELFTRGWVAVTEERCATRDGEGRPIRVSASVRRDEDGAIDAVVCIAQDLSERRSLEERLQHSATHDSITELPNRVLFLDRLHRAVMLAQRRNTFRFALLLVDVDRFKQVNDGFGHAPGDGLLRSIAERLQACTRTSDTVARLGSDEFGILVEEIRDMSDAVRVADRIDEAFREPLAIGDREVFLTVSVGVVLSETGYDRPEDVLRDGDIAMARAKARGGACHEVFDTTMRDRVSNRLSLESDLRRAIEREQLRVHYQPIVELESRRLVGMEALVRWQHPNRGTVAPLEFIGVAEETGAIIPIDRWVLREACRQMADWNHRLPGPSPWMISVNLSSKQFAQPDLVPYVADVLRETGLASDALKLEITESALLDKTDATTATLLELRALGVQLKIDDFGTGYSSLSYLHRLPIDMLKIDRSFVRNMQSSGTDLAIVHTILLLAQALDIRTVAEGVESLDQASHLRSLKCEFAQGFLFSKPLDAEGAEQLIARARFEPLLPPPDADPLGLESTLRPV